MTTGFSTKPTPFERRRAYPTYGEHGLVAAAHPLAVDAGLQIMHQGGNAFDVAVASALATAVVMPEMCGLGGELFAVWSVRGAQPQSIHASGRSPRNASYEFMQSVGGRHMPYSGPHSIAVPGMVDSYFYLLENYGTMSFAQVAEPAISLARFGYPLHAVGARAIANAADLLAKDSAAASVFLPGNSVPEAGSRIVQPDLANTIEQLAREGAPSFYQGDLAKRMIRYLQSIGSRFELQDFADYSSDHSAPLSTEYRGHTVYHPTLPSQGILLLMLLNMIESADLTDPQSAEAIHVMVEAKKLAYADRLAHLGDGRDNPVRALLDKEYARARFESIDPMRAAQDIGPGAHSDGDTTYLCAADAHGNMVSLVQSVSSAFGSGIVAGDTGVVMNNRAGRGFSLVPGHPNVYAPGKRSMHTLNAFLIADQQGRPIIVGGTPGGDGQPQWNAQAIVGMIDAGYDVQATIDQPRWTSWPGTDPSTIDHPFELRMEDRAAADVRDTLAGLGHNVVEQSGWGGGGAMQVIARDPSTGVMIGGSDARVEGTVLGR